MRLEMLSMEDNQIWLIQHSAIGLWSANESSSVDYHGSSIRHLQRSSGSKGFIQIHFLFMMRPFLVAILKFLGIIGINNTFLNKNMIEVVFIIQPGCFMYTDFPDSGDWLKKFF